MISVYYDEYTNDFWKKEKERSFYNLAEFQDWFFGLCKSAIREGLLFPCRRDPDGA